MSQTVITLAFEQWKAQQGETGEVVLLDEFVFANVPGLDPAKPIDRNENIPPAGQIVHRQAVSRKGVVNENAVVHSVVLGADVGDFSFNWIGLINRASGTLAMIVHAPVQQKLKTKEGQQGNVLTRSFLMEYNGAQAETAINTPAETWQIDFTARMAGMDERQRLENTDIYGDAAFFGDGWLVGKSGNQYFVTKGTGYVAGLRADLAANQNITVAAKPVKVWLDVCWTGGFTSAWEVQTKVTVAASLTDYEQNGVRHHVFALASIDASGNITDLRPKGSLVERVAVKSVDNVKPDAKGNVDTMRGDAIQPVIKLPPVASGNSSYIKIATIKDCGSSSGFFQVIVSGTGNYGRPGQSIEEITVSCRGIAAMTAANVDNYINHKSGNNGSDSQLRVVVASNGKAGEFNVYINASSGWWSGVIMRVESMAGGGVYITGAVLDRKMGANAWTTNKPANSFMATRFNMLTSGDTGTSGTKIPLLSTANTWSEIQTFKKDINVGAVGDTSVISMGGASQIIRDNGKKGLIITSASGALAGNGAGLYLRPKGSTDSAMELVGNATGWSVDKFTATTFTVNGATSLKGGVTVTNGAIVYGETNSVMNRTETYPNGTFVNGGLVRSFIFGRGAYGDTRGAFTSLYIQELVGSYNQAVLNLNGFGNDNSWIFRNDGSFHSPGPVYVGNAWMAADGNIWGTRWKTGGAWLWDAITEQINGVVRDVRMGSPGTIILKRNGWNYVPGGCAFTGWYVEGDAPVDDTIQYKPIQILVNGSWRTIAG
ncbi:phage tail-collar fiber domain-containing protein [Klebsiella aerogenes]|uniref:phage tail-collar fiber domain-containing protein n=1 Tax=Klebsiella aerogenes TaxID=548 RepID=UPI000B280983|nr:phage tail protein [Klebsiella aerogenes]